MIARKAKLRGGARHGFTRLELAVIVAISSLLLVPMLFTAMYQAKSRSQRMRCTDNLKQLGLAFKTWGLEHDDRFPMAVPAERGGSMAHLEDGEVFRHFQALAGSAADPQVLVCPADVRRAATNMGNGLSNANLSYFVGLDATDTNPQMFLLGDRNLTNGPLPPNRILTLNTNFPVAWTSEMHHYQGNIGLADGSVQQYSRSGISNGLRNGGSPMRLVMP